MRTRLLLAVALAVASLLAADAGAASPKVLDGKKVKRIVVVEEMPTGAVPVVDPTDRQVVSCVDKKQCARLSFVYRPARGMRSGLTVLTKWFFPTTTDVDLYLVRKGKVLAACGGEIGNERVLQIPRKSLRKKAVYTAVAFFTHTSGETLALEVHLPAVKVAPVTNEDPYDHRVMQCG